MSSEGSTPGSDQRVLLALHAWEVRELVGRDDPVIIEVGANAGQTTAELLEAMPGAIIHAFEPDPRPIAEFRANIAGANVHLYECAVGAQEGEVTFWQSSGGEDRHPEYAGSGWDQSGSIREPLRHREVWPWVKFERQITVPIVTLDAWAARHGVERVDFIWADTQGAESDLVAGAARLLRATRFLYTEYSDQEWYRGQVTLAQLRQLLPDFELVRQWPMDALFRNVRITS